MVIVEAAAAAPLTAATAARCLSTTILDAAAAVTAVPGLPVTAAAPFPSTILVAAIAAGAEPGLPGTAAASCLLLPTAAAVVVAAPEPGLPVMMPAAFALVAPPPGRGVSTTPIDDRRRLGQTVGLSPREAVRSGGDLEWVKEKEKEKKTNTSRTDGVLVWGGGGRVVEGVLRHTLEKVAHRHPR